MAVTPISPPVGELASSTTPVRFSVDNLVGLIIGVDHSDDEVSRPVELVYAPPADSLDGVGVFLYPYLGSTLIGNTFSILRQGGWASFEERNKVRVWEQEAVPTDGQGWTSIYDLNLTAQANQTMTAAGAYTIDGHAWWAKGGLGAGSLNALVNGSGLRLFAPATVAAPIALWRGTGATAAFPARAVCFALSQIPDFNPLAPYAVQWRYASPAALSADASRCPIGGIVDVAASSAAMTGAEKDKAKSIGLFGTSAAYWIRSPYNGGSDVNIVPSAVGTSYANIVQGIVKFSTNRYYPLVGAYGAGMGTPDNYTSFNADITPAFLTQGLSNSPSFFFCLDKASTDGQTLDVYLTHLRVLQPKVAA